MKSLAVSDRYGWPRYVAHQAYYSLVGRDYEWELMPLGARSGRRHGRLEPARLGPADRQDPPRPAAARRQPPAEDGARSARRCRTNFSIRVVDALDAVAKETGKTVPQVALNWLLQRPTVASVISARATKNSCGRTSARWAGR